MKNTFLILVICGLSVNTWAGNVDDISFLRGCWGMTNEHGSKVTEDWFKNSNDTMLGVSQTINNGNSTVSHEFLKIEWDDMRNAISYTPIIDGHAMAPFFYDKNQSSSGTHNKAVLINSKKNDFPESITYNRNRNDLLSVSLAGHDENGKALVIEYDLHKEDCNDRF